MSENDYCPCRICKNITPMVGTKLCDECYELERRIQSNPSRAQKILDQINPERDRYRSALMRIEQLNIEAHREAVNIACTALHLD